MTLWSINRLALAFLLVFTAVLILTGSYFWLEAKQTFQGVRGEERQIAAQEVRLGLTAISKNLFAASENLSKWDETRQQLISPEYYEIWRDVRIRDAGKAPPAMTTVALYDKNGRIISKGSGPMPMDMGFPIRIPLVTREQGKDYLYIFESIHASPDGGALLGYVGIKAGFAELLQQAYPYRYADLGPIDSGLTEGQSIALDEVRKSIRYGLKPNAELTHMQQVFDGFILRLMLAILACTVVTAWMLRQVLIAPLRRLSDDVDQMRDHDSPWDDDRPIGSLITVHEFDKLRRSLNDHHKRLSRLNLDLTRSNRNFFDQARRDALTGIYNRRAFDDDWHSLGEDRRLGKVALMAFDCDHFKAINDTYGHPAGDAVLRAIADCLQRSLRTDDRLYRLGGDEFATVLADADTYHAEVVAERCMRNVIEYDFRQYGMTEPATISIGVALSDWGSLSLSELQKRADLAMYRAKRPGFHKIQFYREETDNMAALAATHQINAIFQAIRDPAIIEFAYQPVIRLPLQQQEYVETLVRIRAEGEIIHPGAIFPIVHAHNLDVEFDLAVIRAVERELDAGKFAVGQGISINISAPSIAHAHVVDALVDLLGRHKERKIVVEVTETALISQLDLASQNIRRLRDQGALIALDDFGSANSSLRLLASMPVDMVKFDISMIQLLGSGDSHQKLMMAEIADLIITAGYELVAEGIETREMLDRIISLGFTHAQGFYFGKPIEPIG